MISEALVDAALTQTCEVCKARKGQPCINTIRPGEPLPARLVHYARIPDGKGAADE